MTKTNSIEKVSIADEFQVVPINDLRLINRLINLALTLDQQPEKSIPEACQNTAQMKAAYQFFDNNKVTPEAILHSHYLNTIARMKKYPLILLIQDTSLIDFTTLKRTKGLGPYSNYSKTRGLIMHSVLAVNPNGVPLGLVYQNIWSRENYPSQKKTKRQQLPIEEKESYKWLKAIETSVKGIPDSIHTVTVADREADIFEFFQKAIELDEHLLVRAVHNRRITGEYQLLYDQINSIPEIGQCMVEISRRPEQNLPPRQAKLSIRFCPVTIRAKSGQQSDIPLYVIFAREIDIPEGEESVEWLLLTTVPVTTLTEAVQKIEWYRERWKIERFHYTLKSGCSIEDLQLETSERLMNAIALYSVIAWRLTWLTYQTRITPNLSCEIILETQEWQALYCVVNKTKVPPDQPPTLDEAVRLIAKLGGFLGRKHDGQPGVKVIWRGLQKLNTGMQFLDLANPLPISSKDVGNV